MRKDKPATPRVNNLVVISDTHGGCRLGLCPPDEIPLDDGGTYKQSKAQGLVWNFWEKEFWGKFVPEATHGEPYAVLCNGDALDGRHHGSVTQVSQNTADQIRIAMAFLKPVVEKCEGRYYHIRGTEAHVGPSAENEEILATMLGAVPDSEGRHARWATWFKLGRWLIHATHHIGTTGTMHYESTAVMKELAEAYTEAGRWGTKPPDVIVRGHRHRAIAVQIPTARTYGVSCTTAGWQLMTPFAMKTPGARQSTPQIGGLVVRAGDHDIYVRQHVASIGRGEEVEL